MQLAIALATNLFIDGRRPVEIGERFDSPADRAQISFLASGSRVTVQLRTSPPPKTTWLRMAGANRPYRNERLPPLTASSAAW